MLLSTPALQTLAGIMSGQQRATQHPILEPFYRLLADLKEKVGNAWQAIQLPHPHVSLPPASCLRAVGPACLCPDNLP